MRREVAPLRMFLYKGLLYVRIAGPYREDSEVMGENQRRRIQMNEQEIAAFLEQGRTATIATIGPEGMPHLVAMWYGLVNGKVYFDTKTKSQKAVNLRRDPRIVVMLETGDTYEQLRGVAIEGTAHLIEDADSEEYWVAAISAYERHNGAYSDKMRPIVEGIMKKRTVVRVDPTRFRSWDHSKLE